MQLTTRSFCRWSAAILFAISFVLATIPSPAQESQRGLTRKEETAAVSATAASGRWAVVIGIANYKNLPEDQQLKYPESDARAFADILKSPQCGSFPPDHVRLLLGEQATLAALRSSLGTWLVRSAEPDDIIYIYFAGHGIVETDGSHDGYLVPYDADPQDFYASALSMSELRRIISERLKARAVVLITDACHAGTLGPARRGGERGLLLSRYIEEASKISQGSMLLILASRENELSYEDARWGNGHGVFTYSLLKGLSGDADTDHDGVVRASELIGYVAHNVPEETKAAQHPQTAGNFDPQMALAVVSARTEPSKATAAKPVARKAQPATSAATKSTLEVRGPAGSLVYLDDASKGAIRPSGRLLIEGLSAGRHEVSVDLPGSGPVSRTVEVAEQHVLLDFTDSIKAAGAARTAEAAKATELRKIESEAENARGLEEIGQGVINRYLQGGRFDLKPEDFRDAAAAFAKLAPLRPDDKKIEAKRLFCEGRALVFDRKYQEAYDTLKRSSEIDAMAAYTNNAMGLVLAQLGRHDAAMEKYRVATNLAPRWGYPHNNIGNLFLDQKKYREAEMEFRKAIELDPRDTAPHNGLANLCLEQKNYAEAENHYRAALKLEPASASLHANLANLYLERKMLRDAAQEFRRAIELDPKDAYPHIGLGCVLLEQGKAGEAEAELHRAIGINSSDPVAHNALATLYLGQSRMAKAETEYRRAAELDSRYADPHYALGTIYEGQGRHAEAAREFDLFVKLSPSAQNADEARRCADRNRKLAAGKQP